MSIYAETAKRTLAAITKKGAVVTFPGTASPGTYNPTADSWSGAGNTDAIGRAVQVDGDPDRFAALNLVLSNPVTLLIAARGLSVTPRPGMSMTWANVTYTIKDVETVGPDGTPILYAVIGST